MARKLATGLKSLGLRENAHIGLISKLSRMDYSRPSHCHGGLYWRSFFPTLNAKEINTLLTFGDVDLLFTGRGGKLGRTKSRGSRRNTYDRFPPL